MSDGIEEEGALPDESLAPSADTAAPCEQQALEPAPPLSTPPPPVRRPLITTPAVGALLRVIAFFLLYTFVYFALSSIPQFKKAKAPRGRLDVEQQIGFKTQDAAAVLLTTLLLAFLERRRMADYGLPLRQTLGARFWIGSLIGFASITLFIAILEIARQCVLGPPQLHGSQAIRFGALWGIVFLLVALGEELVMRGYILATLTRAIGFWPSALATSLLFAIGHLGNSGETSFGLFDVFAFGMLASLMLRRTGSLWLPIGYHAFWDWGQTYFFGVPDSGLIATGSLFRAKIEGPEVLTGGSVGPEGSILVFLILVATAAAMGKWKRKEISIPSI